MRLPSLSLRLHVTYPTVLWAVRTRAFPLALHFLHYRLPIWNVTCRLGESSRRAAVLVTDKNSDRVHPETVDSQLWDPWSTGLPVYPKRLSSSPSHSYTRYPFYFLSAFVDLRYNLVSIGVFPRIAMFNAWEWSSIGATSVEQRGLWSPFARTWTR
jgi:hypothetical protein